MDAQFAGRRWNIDSFGEPGTGAPLVIVLAGSGTTDELKSKLAAEGAPSLWLAAPQNVDWDRDYTPWRADTGNGRVFSGGADEFGRSVAEMRERMSRELRVGDVYIVGYSLGGLAAMYFHTKMKFDGCGSCSGSAWYPGWTEYLEKNPPKGRIYISLGGREKNSGDKLMSTVADATERIRRICERTADSVFFRSEPGGHFRDPDGRLARAICMLCRQ